MKSLEGLIGISERKSQKGIQVVQESRLAIQKWRSRK
jgi:hypothetical protein